MNLFKSIFLIFLCSSALSLHAQKDVHTKASVDKHKILLGEPLELRVTVEFPRNMAVEPVTIDSFPHFEFLDPPHIDSNEENSSESGLAKHTMIYHLTSFDSGHWYIRPLAATGAVEPDSIGIDVAFTDADPSKPYNDIKDVIPVEEKKKSFPWLIFAGGAVLLILLLYLLFRKKTAAPAAPQPEPLTDPFKDAMQGLQAWKGKTDDAKTYYSGLVSVFRVYIFRKKGILSLQKTTDDLILQLRTVAMDKQLSDKLNQALRLSDLVKFAKYEPTQADHNNTYNNIKEAIEKTEQLP